mgnify:CR=1
MLPIVSQKAVFWSLKGGLLHTKRPPFAMRFAAFYSPTNLPKGRLLITFAVEKHFILSIKASLSLPLGRFGGAALIVQLFVTAV